jgi:DnaJ-class molecular chaperone
VSIGRRFFNLARAELNDLLDRASRDDDDVMAPKDDWGRGGLESLSDTELEAELQRRKRARQEAEEAARTGTRKDSTRDGARRTSPSSRPDPVRQAYAALEVPYGSDFATVRKAYRLLMRKYHPDHHTGSADKQKAANELAAKLTDAYKTLEKRLRK